MDRFELQKLRDLPIEGVAERLGLRVSHHRSLCPFHDDRHPSLSFHLGRNAFRCFVCEAKGGPIDLVMRRLGMDFREACRWLADAHNVILDEWHPAAEKPRERLFDPKRYEGFFVHPQLTDKARRFLYDERWLDPRVVRWCRLSSWQDRQGVNWLQTPYFDIEGRLIGVQNRNLDYRPVPPSCGEVPQPRFRFPRGSRCTIYNLPVVRRLRQGDDLYITEGCSDCWAMLSAGHKAIAIPSATLLSHEDKQLLSSLSAALAINWHMYPDRDAPGERLFLQLKEILPGLEHHYLPPECKDFAEWFAASLSGQTRRSAPTADNR